MTVKVITPPESYPVTRTEAKAHCRIDTDDEDTLVDRLIATATAHIDGPGGWLGRALVPQTLELVLDRFPGGAVQIPYPPLISVDSVKYIDQATGLTASYPPSSYEVDTDSQPGWVALASGACWPVPMETINAVRVRFQAGYPAAGSPEMTTVPEPIRHAILLMVADLYEQRESVVVGTISSEVKMATTVENLLFPYRVWT